MEFRHLRYFLVLAEELHFGRAAQRLAITQPPLSLNIQQLEASVGAQLFTRNSRGVQLTAAGQAFVPAARALLDQAQQAAREARDVSQGLVGNLRIGFVGTALYRGLPDILKSFGAAHPRLRLVLQEMSSSEQLIDLRHERLDVGFVHTTHVPAGFSQILLSRQPFVACLPTGHALARRRRLPLAHLHAEPFAMVSRAVSPDYHERFLGLCADAGFVPEIGYELRHWLSVVSLVSQGLAVALVPAAMRQAGLPGVVFVPLDVDSPPYETHCLWIGERHTTAQFAFLDAVRAFAVPIE
ncbi:LysR family transcriptional regulator [Hydrogenophaga sp. BPS33]|uniref:LysR family transcriptional regulator n=1 Tax=Hydrogenophaga sp. BPS33 TaxID=2651974 RepID=UPI00131FFF44|nr:LysR family transcriptional regulator [Hydrogenophaga sp. BPS33]QHE87314.1 LysR family transcriptional regulator [Hydrogenophaga sp. BPS33]